MSIEENDTLTRNSLRPILSHHMNYRCQVDLIHMQSKPDGYYRFIMNYQDHLTKFTILRPLKSITAEKAACGEQPHKHTRKSSSSSHSSIQFLMFASLNTVNHGTPARRTFPSSPKLLHSATIHYHLKSNRRLTPILVFSTIPSTLDVPKSYGRPRPSNY